MVFVICGAAAYALFFAYDLNGAGRNLALLKPLFAIGLALLSGATAGIVFFSRANVYAATPWFATAGAFLLALLVYTLFFALPFKGAYVDGRPPLCTSGMYAICRHPGVLWLGLMYAALYGALPCALTGVSALVFTALDVGYALFQDIYTFPRIFPDYGEYRRLAPFLIPNPASVKRALFNPNNPSKK